MLAQQPRLGAGVVGQAPGNFLALRVAHGNHIAARKFAAHRHHADGQQAFASGLQLGRSAGIDLHRTGQLQVVQHPLLAGLEFLRRGQQRRPYRLALAQAQQHVVLAPPGDDGGGARASRAFGRQNLGQHAALANRGTRAPGHRFQRRIARAGLVHELGRRVAARVGGVQARLVGQDDEHIGIDQVGHQRAQGVVVAKLDLVIDHRVVLVDHRHHAQAQQRQQGGAGVQVALAVGQVGVGQQHLGAAHLVVAQLGFVHLHQAHLPNGGGRLQLVQLFGAGFPAQAFHALGHGPAGDHDQLARRPLVATHQRGQLAGPFPDGRLIQTAPLVGDEAGAHFDDNAPRFLNNRHGEKSS